jgi:hypothetical protein
MNKEKDLVGLMEKASRAIPQHGERFKRNI